MPVQGEKRTSEVTNGVLRLQSLADGAKKLFLVSEVTNASSISHMRLWILGIVEYYSPL